MGSDELHKKRREERIKRKENIRKQKSSKWLLVSEGLKTEPNYFENVVKNINKKLSAEDKLKVDIVGKGMNTTSLVNEAEKIIFEVDKYRINIVPYGKIFVAFDKDSFDKGEFDKAIKLCENNGYIPLWSNEAIEFWFLLHFHYIDSDMSRNDYSNKITEYFKEKGFNYKYNKNDKDIYKYLNKYGSEETAIKNAKKIYKNHKNDKPSLSGSCTTVFKFFDSINERLEEIK